VDVDRDPERLAREAEVLHELGGLVGTEERQPDVSPAGRRPSCVACGLPKPTGEPPRRRVVVDEQTTPEDIPGVVVTAFPDEAANDIPELVRSQVRRRRYRCIPSGLE